MAKCINDGLAALFVVKRHMKKMVGAKIMLLLKPVLCSSCFLIITEIELKRKHFFESNISLENAFTYTLSLHKTTKARGNMNENRHKIPSYTKTHAYLYIQTSTLSHSHSHSFNSRED